MKIKHIVILSFLLIFVKPSFAQTNEFSGWGAWFHSQKLSQHWGLHLDAQFRSADNISYLKNTLIRPGVTYHFNKSSSATVGYLFTYTHNKTATANTYRPEHRIWEQYIKSHKIGKNTQLSHRLRLEQRFVTKLGTQNEYFAQRLRYFARAVVPLKKDSVFTRGAFVGLQNEVFMNVQNKHKVNNHFFDQNRAYAAIGYRFSKMVDLETGYLNQYVKQASSHTINHVWQVALYTRFGN
jgi:hypothetical protein